MIYDTPAKRRDCLALLCGLPVDALKQQRLVEAGLAKGQVYGGKRRISHPVRLTSGGRLLALKALKDAPGGAFEAVADSAILAQFHHELELLGRQQQHKTGPEGGAPKDDHAPR